MTELLYRKLTSPTLVPSICSQQVGASIAVEVSHRHAIRHTAYRKVDSGAKDTCAVACQHAYGIAPAVSPRRDPVFPSPLKSSTATDLGVVPTL